MYRVIDAIAEQLPDGIANYWWQLGMDGPRYVLYGEMIVFAIAWIWAIHRGIRWALHHKKVMGTWWRPDEYRRLMQHLAEEQRNGRVLAFEEVNALNEFTHGKDFERIVNRAYGNRLS